MTRTVNTSLVYSLLMVQSHLVHLLNNCYIFTVEQSFAVMRFAVIWSSSLVDPAVLLAALPRRCYQGKSSLHLRIVHAADPLFVAESQNCMAPRIWKIQTFPLLKNTIADQFHLLRTKVPQILSSISEPHLRIIATSQCTMTLLR